MQHATMIRYIYKTVGATHIAAERRQVLVAHILQSPHAALIIGALKVDQEGQAIVDFLQLDTGSD